MSGSPRSSEQREPRRTGSSLKAKGGHSKYRPGLGLISFLSFWSSCLFRKPPQPVAAWFPCSPPMTHLLLPSLPLRHRRLRFITAPRLLSQCKRGRSLATIGRERRSGGTADQPAPRRTPRSRPPTHPGVVRSVTPVRCVHRYTDARVNRSGISCLSFVLDNGLVTINSCTFLSTDNTKPVQTKTSAIQV